MLRSQPTDEERRGLSFDDAKIDVRADDTGASRFFGYAAVFNVRTAIGNPLTWGFYEELAAGTFTKTLAEGDARFLVDHASYYVVSRVSAGSLYLAQDPVGLTSDSALSPDLSYVNDLKTNVRLRNITGMSFGFQVTKDDWHTETVSTSDGNEAEVEVRIIREVKLIEVSAVTFPAYEETTAGLRHSLVPALLRRGDQAAITRAARHRPDLAGLLGYDADLAPTTVDLGSGGNGGNVRVDMASIRVGIQGGETGDTSPPPGEILGNDTPIVADAGAMQPTETSEGEPAETTRTEDGHDPAGTEPAASTRRALRRELAAAQTEALRRRLSTSAA